MDYQSTTGISAGTNRRRMRNLFPPAGLAGLFPLVDKNIEVFEYVNKKKMNPNKILTSTGTK